MAAVTAAGLVLSFSLRAQGQSDVFAPVAIRYVVARGAGGPVADGAWLAERADWANRIFEPAGVSFRVTRTDELPSGHEEIVTRDDRHQLGRLLAPRVINVFVVASLADVDVEGRVLRGVHWRSRFVPGSHFVILSRIAGRTVLAHELGHFYGTAHSPTPGNILSDQRAGVEQPFFDAAQIRRIRRFARRFARTRELVPGSRR
jgi:hypothetical protein